FFDSLPPYDQTALQIAVINDLSTYRYDELGDYRYRPRGTNDWRPTDRFDWADPKVALAIGRFRSALEEVELKIKDNNTRRPFPYVYMQPSLVPNSISV